MFSGCNEMTLPCEIELPCMHSWKGGVAAQWTEILISTGHYRTAIWTTGGGMNGCRDDDGRKHGSLGFNEGRCLNGS